MDIENKHIDTKGQGGKWGGMNMEIRIDMNVWLFVTYEL